MSTSTDEGSLSAFLAGTLESLDVAAFAGGSLLVTREADLRQASDRGVRIRFLLANPGVGWIDELVRPTGVDPRAYAQRMHINAARALMIGDAVEVRWQPFPIPWWFVVSDRKQVFLKAVNLVGRPPATTLVNWEAVGYYNELFASAWERAEPAVSVGPPAASAFARSPALRVFLCHASDDKPAVRLLYKKLLADGVAPWLDEENLVPGQDWEAEISRALRESDVALVCLSGRAVAKRGFIQREIRTALRVADEMPRHSIFIVPVRLDRCEVPDDLRHLQWVDLFEPVGYGLLSRALRVANQRPGTAMESE